MLLAAGVLASICVAAQPRTLALVSTIPLPSVKGRIDHLAFDPERRRLFIAALGNDTVEVVDTAGNRHERSLAGFSEPQGIAYAPGTKAVYVANGGGNRLDVLDAASLQVRKRFTTLDDADNVRYDSAARTIYVGYGKGALRAFEAGSDQTTADIRLAGHPESFQLEQDGVRIFANVPTAHHVAVLDRARKTVIATWATPGASGNFPMALDQTTHRLFVGARSPAVMLVYDTTSGAIVAKAPIGGDTDDLFFDATRKRVYVVCGEGRVDVFQQESADRYSLIESVRTAPRARTGLFVPETSRLYVAAPAVPGSSARLLVFDASASDARGALR
jgi:DNA-binding beta-propeller fold protein YncE